MSGYTWTETFDDNDNSVWELLAPYEDVQAHFRIRQRLSGNRIEYFNDSDSEYLGANEEWWYSLEEAKSSLEAAYEAILIEWSPVD